MPITEKQRVQRKRHIGSSDSAAIVGCPVEHKDGTPYSTAYDVWLAKTGRMDDCDDGDGDNDAADMGNLIEGSLLDWCAREQSLAIRKNQYRVHSEGILHANHDALVVGSNAGAEAKTTGLIYMGAASKEWGEAMTDEVPAHVMIQCQHQCIVSGLDRVYVPALIGGKGRNLYIVERNNRLCEIIMEMCVKFWNENVLGDKPPEGSVGTVRMLTNMRRELRQIAVDEGIYAAWESAKAAKRLAEKAEDEAKALMLQAMGDANEGIVLKGTVRVTEVTARRIDATLLKEKYPEIAAEVTKESTYKKVGFKKR